ncbi:HAD superfamily hydrolase (TIGR01509 family) [Rhizobium sp. BK077]|nr:HAD superfamily hydrolase (TIGR01509 family) [Rhizobium sp. BK112]MBB3369694.1 HAD superfamily hydrolase (TIGR01509 family) [Rhizobium sp. BK077]MBB4179761.1 HAD superfamily hydrolase (TIGR01509 family) [Rhizobium sp. BK109]
MTVTTHRPWCSHGKPVYTQANPLCRKPYMQRLPRAPKAVLFDMDGLMFDTEALYRDATITAARNAGFELPLSAYLETIGLPASRVRELLLARFGKDAPLEDLWRQASELFTQMVQTDLRTKAGLPEILSFLEAARIPSAIVTSSDRTAVEAHLSAAGLQGRRFQTIIAYGDYTVGKPDPAPYLLAAERLNLPISECVALEDSRNGVLSASGAGAMTIMVPDLVQPAPDIPGRCAYILADLHAVRDLIAISMAGAAVEP